MISKESIKRATLDKVSAIAGAGAGIAGASAIGTAIGSAGMLGSIGSAVGLTVAVATPVGWLVGGAALGAAALYGGSKAIGAKGFVDGDQKAHRTFNSDIEKKLYAKLTTKLSQKDATVAKELLNKIPDEFAEWGNSAFDGLEKGTMPATEIISMCCELLGENSEKYLDSNDFSSTEIELTIKFAMLMALADGEISNEELQLIRTHIINFFELSLLLDDTEIDLIFSQANGSNEQQEQLKNMTFEDIQSLFAVFFLTIKNDRLKAMLPEFLAQVAEADGEISDNEITLYTQFMGLLNAEVNLEMYLSSIENFTQAQNDFLFSNSGSNVEAYTKKVKNALEAYAKGIPAETVISLYDSTVFGKADNGFIVTPLAIITDQAEDIRVIPLGSIYHIALENEDSGDLLIYGEPDENNDMNVIAQLGCVIEELDEFIGFLEAIIEVNLSLTTENYDKTEEWHLAKGGEQLGLHSLDSINSKFGSDELSSNELLAWKDGMAEWLPATEIEEINSIIEQYKVATPPPLPSSPPPLPVKD